MERILHSSVFSHSDKYFGCFLDENVQKALNKIPGRTAIVKLIREGIVE